MPSEIPVASVRLFDSVTMAWRSPLPSSPISASAGSSTSSRTRLACGPLRRPNVSASRVSRVDTPTASRSTANTVTPTGVSASTTKKSAFDPEVMNAFSPVTTQPESVRLALVLSEVMSLPRPPSVSAYDARSPSAVAGQHPLAQAVRAVQFDDLAALEDGDHRNGEARAAGADLLEHAERVLHRRAATAVAGRQRHRVPAACGGLRDEVGGIEVLGVEVVGEHRMSSRHSTALQSMRGVKRPCEAPVRPSPARLRASGTGCRFTGAPARAGGSLTPAPDEDT